MLGDEADQRDEPDLRVDVQGIAGELQRQQRAGHRQRHRQHDDERIDETFELRGEYQIDESEREQKHEIDVVRRIAELTGLPGQIRLRCNGQHAFGRFVHVGQRIALGESGREVGVDGGGSNALKVSNAARAHTFANGDQIGQRHHVASAISHVDFADALGRIATIARHLHDHVILFAVLLEARHQTTSEHGLQRAPDDIHVRSHVLHFVAIDAHPQLRRIHAQIGIDIDEAGVLLHLSLHALHEALHLFVRHGGKNHELNRFRARALPQRAGL